MIEKRFSDICRVILTTGEFFGFFPRVPRALPEDWLREFRNGQLVIKLGNSYLGFKPYSTNEIRVELGGEVDFPKKEKWRSKMEKLKLRAFSYSTLGVVIHSNMIFDSSGSAVKTETISQNESKPESEKETMRETMREITNESEPACVKDGKSSKCPHCKKVLAVSNGLGECPSCEDYIYICPRCKEYMGEDPQDIDFCPLCQKTLIVIDCPNCRKDIFPDLEKCEHCGKEFKLDKCPYSDCGEPLIILEDITECPYCENEIQYISCPHCQEGFYIEGG